MYYLYVNVADRSRFDSPRYVTVPQQQKGMIRAVIFEMPGMLYDKWVGDGTERSDASWI